ncbi:MAG: hypothetical protein U0936_03285 [Planctomycetaceae bacterium]
MQPSFTMSVATIWVSVYGMDGGVIVSAALADRYLIAAAAVFLAIPYS